MFFENKIGNKNLDLKFELRAQLIAMSKGLLGKLIFYILFSQLSYFLVWMELNILTIRT